MEKGKAELRRKIELLEAETRVKQAVIDLTLEQTDDEVESIVVDDLENDPQEYSPNQHDNQLIAQLKPEPSQIPCSKDNIETLNSEMINIPIQPTQELPQIACTTATDNSVINRTAHAISHLTTSELPLKSTPAMFTLPACSETTLRNPTVKATFQSNQNISTMSQLAYSVPVFATCTPRMSTTPYTLQPEHSAFIPNSCEPMTSMSTNAYNTAIPFNTTGNQFNPGYNNPFQSTPYTYRVLKCDVTLP